MRINEPLEYTLPTLREYRSRGEGSGSDIAKAELTPGKRTLTSELGSGESDNSSGAGGPAKAEPARCTRDGSPRSLVLRYRTPVRG